MENIIQELIDTVKQADNPSTLRAIWGKFLKVLAESTGMTSAHLCHHDFVQRESIIEAEYFSRRSEFLESQSEIGKAFPEAGFPYTAAWLRQPGNAPRIQHTKEMPLDDPERHEFVSYQVKTAVFLKIAHKDHVWGYIEMWNSRTKREFTTKELKQLQHITAQFAQTVLAQK